ncbi:hypothetical protein K450DRAFT_234911 [Umbelopsis ramanniana AG]|uniref:RRM domain-containing protein n=1 Tax=Umbelopsis ramanniana AG TaxID=1314678 RepID=A0AAD5HF83_UMBRA|nr:uncharacterized protein K450DRAFT_234911 [Umbelopsis ramanniana AG]KAI8580859.1 hypothetical protein K450DRAFT_234911 [Umbelopsis ramanniana AG]
MAGRGSRVVFVGNIPFDCTEEQLIDVFKEVGPVESFRLVFDKDTGKPKGYGFCEFQDAETASSAVRNLNGYELGGRQLRVDYADMDPAIEAQRQRERAHDNRRMPNQPPRSAPPPMQQTNMPNVGPTPDSRSATDQISGTLASMNPQQLYTLMTQMKQLATDSPDYTRKFLNTNPQITYALFQAMIMMNIVDPNMISRILTNAPTTANAAAPPPMPQNVPPPPKISNAGQQQHFRSPNPQMPYQQPEPMMNPVPGMPQPPAPMPPAGTNDLQQQQRALLMQVLQLSDADIAALPPGQQEQVRQLKQQILMSQN